jgi:cytochrome c oxidase subunit II
VTSAPAPRFPPRPTNPARRRLTTFVLVATTALVAACGETPRDSTTAPASPQATDLDGLWALSLWMGTAVWVAVMILLAVPIVRSRRANRGEPTDPTEPARSSVTRREQAGEPVRADSGPESGTPSSLARSAAPGAELDEPMIAADPANHEAARSDAKVRSRLVWIGGIILPALILIVLLVASGRVGASTAHVERDGELVIDVVGHMFWWEVNYPEEGITTANEIHVPVDRPVRLRLTTQDVIHSFWIPRVHGKIDMIPGRENSLSFEPTATGRFRGQCAEFCGIAHAQMVAFVEVQEQDEFDAWVAGQQADAPEPDTPAAVEGERVFFDTGCAACHAVAGTAAVAQVGPDLTHLASRGSLAGGIVPNTRENLAELIVDPWGLKPGNPMPPTALEDDELEALLDYMETLD